MVGLAVVGFGAIGQALARLLQGDANLRIVWIVATPRSIDGVREIAAQLAPHATVALSLSLAADASRSGRPDVVVECAGHAAIVSHVVPALEAGVPCIVASVGALADDALQARLDAASARGRARLRLVSGAVGGLDAISAARLGGLDRVRYTGRKPPRSWAGTPAEQACRLATLTGPTVVFEGSARDAALAFPQNANVAATVALAGLGLDRTEVQLVADPGVVRNVHRVEASGAFGKLSLDMENLALPDNPKTSALTVWSVAAAVREEAAETTRLSAP